MQKIVLGSLIGLLVITGVATPVLEPIVAHASDHKDEKLKELKKEKEKLEKKKKNATKEKKKTEKKIKNNKKNQKELEKEIQEIDEKVIETKDKVDYSEKEINKTENKVKELTKEIKGLEGEIKELNEQIEVVQERIDRRSEIIGNRLLSIQHNGGNISYLEVLFGTESFTDFIGRLTAVQTIMNQDQDMLSQQVEDRKIIEANKKKVENNKNEIESQKNKLEQRKVKLKKEKKELVALQKELDKKVKEKEELIEKLKKEHKELTSEQISAKEEEKILKLQAEIVEKVIEQHKKNPDALVHHSAIEGNGILLRPAIGRLSSKFGIRIHPITGERKKHRGMDIAAPTGTPVIAAGSGTVTHAAYTGGYGNVIFIYHPHLELTTVYAHLSKIHVKPGQPINVGKRIGDIGSTGDSTGPHLHFEVHLGQYNKANAVDPQLYLK